MVSQLSTGSVRWACFLVRYNMGGDARTLTACNKYSVQAGEHKSDSVILRDAAAVPRGAHQLLACLRSSSAAFSLGFANNSTSLNYILTSRALKMSCLSCQMLLGKKKKTHKHFLVLLMTLSCCCVWRTIMEHNSSICFKFNLMYKRATFCLCSTCCLV